MCRGAGSAGQADSARVPELAAITRAVALPARGKLENGFTVTPKYIGSRRLIEIAIATLATDRALLLLGVPGTAKTWVSEHLAAAIAGDSTMLIQGTAGTSEEQIRYGWDYARLLSEGPSRRALVPSPLMRAMQQGKIAVSRSDASPDVDTDHILSEDTPIPELGEEEQAVKGSTSSPRRITVTGRQQLSSALKRQEHRGAPDAGERR